ncbi:MAG: hypothetical protein EZS28_042693 [Streblomastix strix]|uniref:Uncharacterized protein n=1 Tax=Streblomastix strix TaxID=222440 RepID=A0A5J4TUT6_9EUKA|nr:MAG: hypothetical protein EZS28_042693 [Streblomastix strix]
MFDAQSAYCLSQVKSEALQNDNQCDATNLLTQYRLGIGGGDENLRTSGYSFSSFARVRAYILQFDASTIRTFINSAKDRLSTLASRSLISFAILSNDQQQAIMYTLVVVTRNSFAILSTFPGLNKSVKSKLSIPFRMFDHSVLPLQTDQKQS